MSAIATLNGVQYTIPSYNDTGWAQGTGNLSLYLAAIAANTLQPTGGAFTLTADIDFGSNFGLKALYLKSETANISTAGVIRLASADTLSWRNNANAANIALGKDSSDNLQWNATKILLSGAVVNADINASAAIAYSKLTLTGSIVNADIASGAAIAYSKLSLSASVVNADIASAAAIAVNKLAAVTASKVLVSDGSGFVSASTVTTTTLAFLDATSSIQTQLNATVANPLTSNLAAGAHKITGLANGTSSTDAAAFGQIFTGFQAPVLTNSSTGFTTTSTTFVTTNCTGSITPTSASHRIKITFSGVIITAASTADTIQLTLARGTTDLSAGSGFAQVNTATGTITLAYPVSVTFIDSPATTSATTYNVRILTQAGLSIKFGNGFNTPMVLEEIV